MELSKLRFVINETGTISEEEQNYINEVYKTLFSEIYGYDILSKYLSQKENLKNDYVFDNTYINSIDVPKSLSSDNIALLMIYDENDKLIGAGRIKKIEKLSTKNPLVEVFNKLLEKFLKSIDEKCISVPDIAISSECADSKYDIWKLAIQFLESYYMSLGYDRIYVEIPLNSPLLLRADDLGYIEDLADIPVSDKPRTRILNKYLERTKDAEFNSSRK